MRHYFKIGPILVLMCLLTAIPAATLAQEQEGRSGQSELDAFMREVLRTRDENWDQRYNYVFREVETLRIRSSDMKAPFTGFTREWTWFVKDGYLVRSPVSIDGMPISQEEREKAEKRWIESQRKRREKKKGSIDERRFFGFDFKKGNFFYSGREMIGDYEAAVIEYYPADELTEAEIRQAGEKEDYDEQAEKSLSVTLYVLPEQHQIVRMLIHNAGMDFLPGQWLVKILEVRAWMDMAQPLDDRWLVKEIAAEGKASTASGEIFVGYRRRFLDYRKASVAVQFRFPAEPVKEDDDERK